jgi:hypothetical protein
MPSTVSSATAQRSMAPMSGIASRALPKKSVVGSVTPGALVAPTSAAPLVAPSATAPGAGSSTAAPSTSGIPTKPGSAATPSPARVYHWPRSTPKRL